MLYYPTFYEGLRNQNVIYTGREATQQIIAGLTGSRRKKKAKTLSDRLGLHLAAHIEQDARKHIENVLKGTVVGEEYYALGMSFGLLINKIKLKKPDVIYAVIVGGSNVSFYKQLKAAGITSDKQTLLTISTTEDEVLASAVKSVGFYSAMKYFQNLQNPNNEAFVKAFKAFVWRKVRDRRRDAGGVSRTVDLEGDGREVAAVLILIKIAAASSGVELKTAPEGYVRVHDTNHHL